MAAPAGLASAVGLEMLRELVGGSLAAVLLQTQLSVFLRGLKMVVWVVLPPKDDRVDQLRQITDLGGVPQLRARQFRRRDMCSGGV